MDVDMDVKVDHDLDPYHNNFYDDLNPDPDEVRALRKDYRTLTRKIEASDDLSAEQISSQVKKSNELFGRVRAPQEATLDAAFLVVATNLGAQKARALKAGPTALDLDEFVSRLFRYMGGFKLEEELDDEDDTIEPTVDAPLGEPLEWYKIGRKVVGKSHRVPLLDFMLGPLSIERKKRVVTKRAKIQKNTAETKRPQVLKEGDIARSENETSKNVQIFHRLLQAAGETNLFKFVINPNDFAQSVENMFHLSFLIHEGRVALRIDPTTKEPMIDTQERPEDEDSDEDPLRLRDDLERPDRKKSHVFEFDMETWRSAIEIFDIKESMIPQRPPVKTRLGDKWYG